MNPEEFVGRESPRLSKLLEEYLAGHLGHEVLHGEIDAMFSRWRSVAGAAELEPNDADEKAFWCALWTVQHLASDDHWKDGCTQRELSFMLTVLRGEVDLPPEYQGRRP